MCRWYNGGTTNETQNKKTILTTHHYSLQLQQRKKAMETTITMQWSKTKPSTLLCVVIGGLDGRYVEFMPEYKLLWSCPDYRHVPTDGGENDYIHEQEQEYCTRYGL
jgi:hypothetical protein